MECPQCQFSNPSGAVQCVKCKTPLPFAPISATSEMTQGGPNPTPAERARAAPAPTARLEPGEVLGGRYEILQLLGEGGMGAVYKARDRELDRFVALKIIHPDLANRPGVLQRFKQELILARKVTHKNVIRIFDLGEADGIKFISMDYIDGQDLKSMLKQKGKFTPEEAVSVVAQVCRALEAAHAEGVIHRDLKPQNIMLDKQGRVIVMDFGIARSMETPGMTTTGVLVGTPEYMSPEQAKGEKVDVRSDLFTLGIIFYELLTGDTPYRADTALATMLKRTQERARPPVERVPEIPRFMNNVVVRCLEINPELRYQSAVEILRDLETQRAARPTLTGLRLVRLRLVETLTPRWIAPAIAAILLLIAGFAFWGKFFSGGAAKQATVQPISLAILPFRNASGDPKLGWLGPGLAEMLRTDMGQTSYLRTVSSDRLSQILHDLRVSPDSSFEPETLRRVAEFTSADKLVWGQYLKLGDRIRIDATLRDPRQQRSVSLQAEAASEKELPQAVARLADSVEKSLALSPDIMQELRAKALKPSTSSLGALRDYNEGRELARQGRNLDAVKKFQAATEADPQFALAFSELALVDHNLGFDDQAGQYSRKAVDLSATLPPPEKYLIQANHARVLSDNQKAIEAYENLVKASPNDLDIQLALAKTYEAAGSFGKARDRSAEVLKTDPKNVDALLVRGIAEIRMGNSQGSLDYLNQALSLSIQLENDEERAQILYALGLAYMNLNKPQDALRNLQDSLDISRRLDNKPEVARNLEAMGQVRDNLGQSIQAERNYREAEQLSQEIGDKKGLGDVLIDLGGFYGERGQVDKALALFKQSLQIQRDLDNRFNEAMCLGSIGAAYLDKGSYEDALTYFQQAYQLQEKLQTLQDMATTLSNLGETSSKMGEYDQAVDYYLKDLDLRRKMDDKRGVGVASSGLGTIYEYQGRYGAALSAQQDAVKALQALGGNPPELGEIMGAYGNALTLVGRWGEAEKTLEEALGRARELKDDSVTAEILGFQGDNFFYRGDFKSAEKLFAQALATATHGKDRRILLISKCNLAKVEVKSGRSRQAAGTLKALAQEADTMGLKYLSVESSIYLAETLLEAKDYSRSRDELERALGRSDKLGLRSLLARSHFVLAGGLTRTGNGAEAAPHYAEARRILAEIQQEVGSDKVLERSDLSPIAAAPPARPAAGPA